MAMNDPVLPVSFELLAIIPWVISYWIERRQVCHASIYES